MSLARETGEVANHDGSRSTSSQSVEPPPIDDEFLRDFYATLSKATSSVLMLDYDGTLAPFHVDRLAAVPYEGIREVLDEIHRSGKTRIVLVSGRAAVEVAQLLAPLRPLEIFGSHGLIRRTADGVETASIPPNVQDSLAKAGAQLMAHGLEGHVEEKPGCLALHWRGLPDHRVGEVEKIGRSVLRPLAIGGGLQLKAFDGGIELRAKEASKGRVVRSLVAESPSGSFFAYLGDDLTDEDAFEALGDRGFGLLVRSAPRSSIARRWIQPPGQLLDFLNGWSRSVHGGQSK